MAGMQVYYATQFVLPLPPGHRFPMAKYQMLRDRLKFRASFWPGAKDAPGIEKKLRLPKNF